MTAQEALDMVREIRKNKKFLRRMWGFDQHFLHEMEECGLDYPTLKITDRQEQRLRGIKEKMPKPKEGTSGKK